MAGFTHPTSDDRGNDYPDAFWSISESHLKHRDQWARIIVVPYRDKQAFDEGRNPILERARAYEFAPTEQKAFYDPDGNLVRAAIPAYEVLFSESALSEGNPFTALYLFLVGRPEFQGAELTP